MHRIALLSVLLALSALGEPPDVPDPSMVPDASVGQGGAQQSSEETDTSTVCMSDSDCDKGLKCDHFKCVWRQYRQATFRGCGAEAPTLAVLALGLTLTTRRRRSG